MGSGGGARSGRAGTSHAVPLGLARSRKDSSDMGCRKQSGPFVKIWVHKRPKSARDQCLWGGIWKIFLSAKVQVKCLTFLTLCVCVCVCVCVSRSVVSDSSLPGPSVHGISWAGILEWVAIPSPGDLPYPGIKPRSPTSQADSSPSESPPWKTANSGGVRGAGLGKVFSNQLHPSSSWSGFGVGKGPMVPSTGAGEPSPSVE